MMYCLHSLTRHHSSKGERGKCWPRSGSKGAHYLNITDSRESAIEWQGQVRFHLDLLVRSNNELNNELNEWMSWTSWNNELNPIMNRYCSPCQGFDQGAGGGGELRRGRSKFLVHVFSRWSKLQHTRYSSTYYILLHFRGYWLCSLFSCFFQSSLRERFGYYGSVSSWRFAL